MLVKMSQEVKQDCDVLCIDDRKKVFDISHLHCLKTMNEISRLRSKSLLFDVVIKSDGRSFRVSFKIVKRYMNHTKMVRRRTLM